MFRVLTALVVGWALLMAAQGWGLHSQAVPAGILCFEMPRSAARAREILGAWQVAGVVDKARWQIWLDFPFLVIYPLWFAAAIALLLRRLPPHRWAATGRLLGWSMLVVAGLDAYENTLMMVLLDHEITAATARTVTLAARAKFLIIGFAALWLLVSYGWVRRRC